MRIMVVENDDLMVDCLKEIIKKFDHEVIMAFDTGEEAVRRVGQVTPDMILMDIGLNGKMDGIEAARQIRKNYNIPIVFITASTDKKTHEAAKETGPFGYITKPLEIRELQTVISAAHYKYIKDKEIKQFQKTCQNCLHHFKGITIKRDLNLMPIWIEGPVEELVGYSAKRIISGEPHWNELIHPDDHHFFSQDICEKLRTIPNTFYKNEYRVIHKNGKVRWFDALIENVQDSYQRPKYIQEIVWDVTKCTTSKLDNERLIHDVIFYKNMTVEREMTMIKLKNEINELSLMLGRDEPYDIPQKTNEQ